ncbi:hypothetical protein H2Y57_00660 [Pectobacterium aroidearum]|uniref:Uncharacterized protein n=1 Tax=Pectobacterium aroidearum TaxID=1201031 RepID=A0AAW3SPC7_9GAMM|nr:hypothetical protein [Pectobacterium aroidearum]MBA5202214.1 hypothetical protein [Pectobacterium aroidearum]
MKSYRPAGTLVPGQILENPETSLQRHGHGSAQLHSPNLVVLLPIHHLK